MKFNSFKYIYPPRPEFAIKRESIINLNENEYFAQPKLNGSCALLFINTELGVFKMMNRHNGDIEHKISSLCISELKSLFQGNGWVVLVGEYMNKSKKDDGNIFNDKFVIFDILVYDDEHMTFSTFIERQRLLAKIFQPKKHSKYISKISEDIFIVNNFKSNFTKLWDKIIEIDMYEGLVFKKIDGKLENGILNKRNTSTCQVKCRKETKNYNF